QLPQPTDIVLLPGLLGQVHARAVKVEFGALSLPIDSNGCDRRADGQRQQQQNGCPAETGDGRFAPAPTPGFLKTADGPRLDWFVEQEAIEFISEFLRCLVALRRLLLQ